MNYSLFAASKLLQKRGEWDQGRGISSPSSSRRNLTIRRVITALYWIGKAKAHEGQIDEAKRITADTIKKYIGDPQREAVELLADAARAAVRARKSAGRNAAGAKVTSDQPPSVAAPDRSRRRARRAAGRDATRTSHPTARARILFAKAELARLRRQPAEEEKNIAQIAEKFKPEDLSPMLARTRG